MKRKLKIGKKHQVGRFQLGRHTITFNPTIFDLNKEEEKELQSVGCKFWITEILEVKKSKKGK